MLLDTHEGVCILITYTSPVGWTPLFTITLENLCTKPISVPKKKRKKGKRNQLILHLPEISVLKYSQTQKGLQRSCWLLHHLHKQFAVSPVASPKAYVGISTLGLTHLIGWLAIINKRNIESHLSFPFTPPPTMLLGSFLNF